jgi:exonuclease III
MARFNGQLFRELKITTWNVRGVTEKIEELQTELLKRKTDIAIIRERKDQKT